MVDPVLRFRIKIVLTLMLLGIVTAFAVTYLTGQAGERAAREAAAEHARDVPVPP